jgi:hypothetical protein
MKPPSTGNDAPSPSAAGLFQDIPRVLTHESPPPLRRRFYCHVLRGVGIRRCTFAAPWDEAPRPLMQIIQNDLCDDFEAGDRAGKREALCDYQAQDECVDTSRDAPTYGLGERASVRLTGLV